MSKRHLALISIVSLALLSACSSTKLDNTTDVSGKAVDAAGVSAVASVVADHLNPTV
jgi:hypothetical protein